MITKSILFATVEIYILFEVVMVQGQQPRSDGTGFFYTLHPACFSRKTVCFPPCQWATIPAPGQRRSCGGVWMIDRSDVIRTRVSLQIRMGVAQTEACLLNDSDGFLKEGRRWPVECSYSTNRIIRTDGAGRRSADEPRSPHRKRSFPLGSRPGHTAG